MVDTHCHLDMCEEGSLERAREAGLSRIATIGMDDDSWPKAVQLAEQHDDVHAIVGVHPNSAAGFNEGMIEAVREYAERPGSTTTATTPRRRTSSAHSTRTSSWRPTSACLL
jgi:TatD DNase family protein